jgi:hypothetical protein
MPFLFSKLYAALGINEKAFWWLTKSYQDRDIAIVLILTDETIANLRSDPKFSELLKKMGLYKYMNQTDIKSLYGL